MISFVPKEEIFEFLLFRKRIVLKNYTWKLPFEEDIKWDIRFVGEKTINWRILWKVTATFSTINQGIYYTQSKAMLKVGSNRLEWNIRNFSLRVRFNKFYRYFTTRDIVSGTNCISLCNYPQVITCDSSKSGRPINCQLLPSCCHDIKSTKLKSWWAKNIDKNIFFVQYDMFLTSALVLYFWDIGISLSVFTLDWQHIM